MGALDVRDGYGDRASFGVFIVDLRLYIFSLALGEFRVI